MVTMPDLNPGAAFLVDERYKITGQMGSLGILDHGQYMKFVYDSATDQSFLIQGTKCSVGTLLDHPGYSFFGWYYTSGNGGHKKRLRDEPIDNFVFGPSALLKMTEEFREDITYQGQSNIRSIPCDHWQLYMDDGYTIEYYFAADEWVMPYGQKILGVDLKYPVQVVVTGLEGNPWNPEEQKKNQSVYYDYLEFKPYVLPEDFRAFMVEGGLDCPKRKTMDPKQTTPPDPVPDIKVYMESITNRTEGHLGIVFSAWLYYDAFRQLMRMDIDGSEEDHIAPVRNIQDMYAGIQYSIDEWTGSCTTTRWSQESLGNLVGPEIAGVMRADPAHLFALDSKYIFTGYDEERGLLTSRWSATRNDIPNSEGHNHRKVVVDYHFLSKYVDDIGEYTTTPLPVKIEITVYNDKNLNEIDEVQRVNLLQFQSSFETYELNPFDVGECFNLPTSRNWYKIFFEGSWDKGASQNQDEFKRQILQKMNEDGKVSYVRLPKIELSHDELFVYAHVLVLEPADYLLQFQQPEAAIPWKSDTQIEYSINDAESCAALCLFHFNIGFNCLSFYKCTGQKLNCFVSSYKEVKTPPRNITDCQHYVVTTDGDYFQFPNYEVYDFLKNDILAGRFLFKFEYKDEVGLKQEGTFKGIKVTDEISADDPVFVDFLVDQYRLIATHMMLDSSYSQLSIVGSYDECLLGCDTARGFDCQTFSYCYSSQNCFLSREVVDSPIDLHKVVAQGDCVVVARKHTSDYTRLEGAFYQSDPKQTIPKVRSGEQCAFLCDNSTDFMCRSFDICYDTVTCYLYEERSIDIPDEKINHSLALCDHFERDALVDFKKHPKQVLDGSRDRYVDDVSVKECADVCEKEPDYGCNGFDFCYGTPNTCFLTKDHYGDDGVVIHNKIECDHYSREYYDGKDRDDFSHDKLAKYKYGPGDMAGLGVSMLVISIALTLGGVYVYNTRNG